MAVLPEGFFDTPVTFTTSITGFGATHRLLDGCLLYHVLTGAWPQSSAFHMEALLYVCCFALLPDPFPSGPPSLLLLPCALPLRSCWLRIGLLWLPCMSPIVSLLSS